MPRPRLLIFYASHSTTLVREGRRFGIERTGNEPLRRGADFRAQRKPPRTPRVPFSPPGVCVCAYVCVCPLTPAISRKMNFERGQACRTGLEILDVLDKFWEERDGVRIRMIKGWMFLGCEFFSRLWPDWIRHFWLLVLAPLHRGNNRYFDHENIMDIEICNWYRMKIDNKKVEWQHFICKNIISKKDMIL